MSTVIPPLLPRLRATDPHGVGSQRFEGNGHQSTTNGAFSLEPYVDFGLGTQVPFGLHLQRTPDRGNRLLEAKEVAEILGVGVSWVRESTRSGRLPCVRLGRYVRYDEDDLLAWVESMKDDQIYGRSASYKREPSSPSSEALHG